MHCRRVYVDNSVFGGVFDDEFSDASKRFFHQVERGQYRILISEITIAEISDAPEDVVRFFNDIPGNHMEEIPLGSNVRSLAEAYVTAKVVGPSHMADATQVAAATVARADLILSWNFRHIVNFDRIHQYNAVNLLNGYHPIEIRSPLEVVYGDEEQDV